MSIFPTATVVTMADVCYAPLQPFKSSQNVPNPNYAIPTHADRMENGLCACSLPIAPKMRVHH